MDWWIPNVVIVAILLPLSPSTIKEEITHPPPRRTQLLIDNRASLHCLSLNENVTDCDNGSGAVFLQGAAEVIVTKEKLQQKTKKEGTSLSGREREAVLLSRLVC